MNYLIVDYVYCQSPEIPNAGFENWVQYNNYKDPAEWKSINSETVVFGSTLVTQTEDAYTGSYALRLETKNVLVVAPAAISLGRIVNLGFTDRDMQGGIPSSVLPKSFEGYYKFNPIANDYGFISCLLFKYNTITGKQDTVTSAIFKPNTQVNDYTHFKVDVTYHSGFEGQQHDTMNIVISSSYKFGNPKAGTVLYVDDLKVNYSNASVEDNYTSYFSIYPNPSNGIFWINNPENKKFDYDLVDLSGRIIKSNSTTSSKYSIDLSDKDGFYILNIKSEDRIFKHKLIISNM